MGEFVTEILLGFFVFGSLLLHSHHAKELKLVQQKVEEVRAEIADTTGRVVNLEHAASLWLKKEERQNGRTA